jgi:hypothetical protein
VNYLRRFISQWIGRLSEPNPAFNNLPACPHAAKALYACCTISDATELAHLLRCVRLDPWRVLLILIDFPLEEDVRNVLDLQRSLLESRDLLALVSDSRHPMKIAGYQTTQTAYYFVIVQRKSEIETASKVLKEKGYYKNWSPEQLKWLENRK